jgi:hypothetical protein
MARLFQFRALSEHIRGRAGDVLVGTETIMALTRDDLMTAVFSTAVAASRTKPGA